ncbi:MAG TPA: asparagine synthase (glutamine-hydrolyzing), partial [Bryobacteraceae bacterium]|nr:asparagine synthase (glutamine-hydrolyzing) [Bryobacteraceae bacterium]
MCGIAGYVGSDHPDTSAQILRRMVDAIARRGPDSEGIAQWPGALLGHRRLAILDLSEAGRQPMLSDNGRIGIVFNGCIYNFIDLRRELESYGHSFRSNCDTEVLIKGYQQWGAQALVPRLRGMFAFAIWDADRRVLTLARDRLGVKPLVFAAEGGRIAFASTVGALRAAGLVHEIDPAAVLEFLEFGYVTEDRTIFRGAAKLPPATILEWKDGLMEQRTYWTLPRSAESVPVTFEEAIEETERLLLESVRLRLCSDVPIGALLSGGIDSALVCWATAKLNADIRAYTISTPGDPADEAPATLRTARILGIPHEVVQLPRDSDNILDDLTNAYGEPFGCSSALAMLRVSGAVKPFATVLLTGDGGDDVFLGYSFHRNFLRTQRIARLLPSFAGSAWSALRPLVNGFAPLRRGKHFLDYATGGLGAVARAHNGLPYYTGRLGQRLAGLELAQRTIPLSAQSARKLLEEFLDYQQRMWFVAEFMTKVDGATMYYGLEARSPFLDHKLWEFAAAIPQDVRLRGGVLKAILREIVSRRISPE